MCTARAVVISKWWLIWMFSDFQSVLFPPLERNRGELKGNTRWPFLWHELGNLSGKDMFVWILWHYKQRLAKDIRAVGLPEAFAGKWSHIQRWVSAGVTLGSLSLTHGKHHYQAFPWSWEAGSSNERQLVPNGLYHGLLFCWTLLGKQSFAGTQEGQFWCFDIGWLKLGVSSSGIQALCVCVL